MSHPIQYFFPDFVREKTRKQIVEEKIEYGYRTFPVSLVAVNFTFDGNLGFLIRTAACFGASEVLVIGSVPNYRDLKQLSCATNHFVNIKQFSNPSGFLNYARENEMKLISMELCDQSVNILDYKFEFDRKIAIVVGNETTGVPSEILMNSDCVMIPLPGPGPCLNTSQAANIALYEYVRQGMLNGKIV